ncbi:MAG: hypothetical protein L0G93_09610 [Acinetobacter sp.]|nr:hypothetical protein [Acinetobacter sp.]MDN5623352.1 hypothetical protein [Acinetobacter sp.]MDN5648573.1 hypothetical protein [Acinetobacter sp.]
MKTRLKIALISTVFLISSCTYANNNKEDSNSMLDLNNTKDWCSGRYTFKLPQSAILSGGGDNFHSFKITSKVNATQADLDMAYKNLLKEHSSPVTKIILDSPQKKIGNKIIKVFSGKLGTAERGALDAYGFALDKGVLFSLKLTYSLSKKDIVFSELNEILVNLTARNNNQIPKEAGICIANGFIKDDGKEFTKSLNSLAFQFKGLPSVRLSLEVDAASTQLADLITRKEKFLKEKGLLNLTTSSFKTISKGQKNQIGGDHLTGLEWVSTAPMKGQNGVLATWEHAGVAKNALDPAIQLEIDTGFDGNNIQTSSLNEKESLKLYETILNTIKKF